MFYWLPESRVFIGSLLIANVGIGVQNNDNQVRFPVEFLPQFTNDSAEQEQPLRDCPSQRFNKPDSYHNLFIVSWITRQIYGVIALTSGSVVARKPTLSLACDLSGLYPFSYERRGINFTPQSDLNRVAPLPLRKPTIKTRSNAETAYSNENSEQR
ncbi:hypothetical protein T4D_8266 [Trichinella pseudospiralis]|uniref:Uncharacterized protein n=1 Tax=Trichinella pseudospiralis TaxID=6337 RepID=A0A0V1F4V7_TRIPS|nr:hypothetical protein T4D_8266 [Trichinella pseudospiralis]